MYCHSPADTAGAKQDRVLSKGDKASGLCVYKSRGGVHGWNPAGLISAQGVTERRERMNAITQSIP